MREFGRGIGMLFAGLGWWRRRPGTMALGLVPAALVGVVLVGLLITLAAFLPGLADATTPFADSWPPALSSALRIAVGTAFFAGALFLCAITFTALTLIVGEPFYDRVWRSVEIGLGGSVPDQPYGFWRAAGDAMRLIARGILVASLAGLLGLIPVAGAVVGTVVGTLLTGWLLADELCSRALTARGLERAARRALLRAHRGRALGFGVATQLCFLVPLGAVVVMPAAVAGSTMLARGLVGEVDGIGAPVVQQAARVEVSRDRPADPR
ncbi:EI24 domain-containing protein [Microbacterium sp. 1P10UB]|uniref:EI24 domain-containing protein n=1 Tax=unclassified Microbacterium TaxID=2609290 RepID=UPI00399F7AB1